MRDWQREVGERGREASHHARSADAQHPGPPPRNQGREEGGGADAGRQAIIRDRMKAADERTKLAQLRDRVAALTGVLMQDVIASVTAIATEITERR